MKAYLAHSVHERDRGLAFQRKLESYGYTVINPFSVEKKRVGQIIDWNDLNPNNGQAKAIAAKIILGDLTEVAQSDMIIVILPVKDVTIGIPCEMIFAWMLHKECYTLAPERLYGHPWIIGLSKHVWKDREEMLRFLHDYAGWLV